MTKNGPATRQARLLVELSKSGAETHTVYPFSLVKPGALMNIPFEPKAMTPSFKNLLEGKIQWAKRSDALLKAGGD